MSNSRNLADLSTSITSNTVTFNSVSANTVSVNSANINGNLIVNSTGCMVVPIGTTAERPSSAVSGSLRYNSTTGYFETYTAAGWGSIATPPSITSVSPTFYNGESGTSFTITGSFFDPNASVKFITSQGTEYTAATVSYINSSQLTATTPQDFTVANEPLKVKVVNASGLFYTLDNAIDCGGVPIWYTSAGTIATYSYPANTGIYSTSVSAYDPDANATITYSVTSGALPSGSSLNSSNGQISGINANGGSSVVTSYFDISATDNAGNISSRSFNIIRRWLDGSSASQAASSATSLKSVVGGSPSNGAYYYNLPSGVVQLYTDFTSFSNYPMILVSRICETENQLWQTGALNISDLTVASTTKPTRTSKISDVDMNHIMVLNTIRWVIVGNRDNFYRMNDITWTSNFGTAQNCPSNSNYNKLASASNTPTWLDFSGYNGGCGGGQYNSQWLVLSGIHTSDTILGAYSGASTIRSTAPAAYTVGTYADGNWNCAGYVFLGW